MTGRPDPQGRGRMNGRRDLRTSGFSQFRLLGLAGLALLTGFVVRGVILPAGDCRPSAPRGTAPGAPAKALTEAATPGPRRFEHGVPVGFARTENGAVAAAAGYVRTGQAFLEMDGPALEEAVRTMAATSSSAALLSETVSRLESARAALAGSEAPIDYHQAILSVRLDDFGPDHTRVSVWSVGVLSREGVASPQAGWSISTFDLVWERDDWKVLAESIVPGPAPIMNAAVAPATSAQMRQRLAGFKALGGEG